MSPQDQTVPETTSLLGDTRPAGQSGGRLSKERFRCSPETPLVPVIIATTVALVIPSTTYIELLRQAVCRIWTVSHGEPTTLPAGVPSPELCDAPEVAQYFATVIAMVGVIEGMISIGVCGVLSRISSQYGRKPAFVFVLVAGVVGSCLIPGSLYAPDQLAGFVFVVGMLFQLFSGYSLYIANIYLVDVCPPDDRTAVLSKISGWQTLGTCVSYALGGSITTKTGNPVIVYCASVAIFATALIYVVFVLPESFPEEKRKELASAASSRLSFLFVFEPLKTLVSTRKPDGTRNWRLAWCAAHLFVFTTANVYASAAWMVLVTSKYHLTPAETGVFFTSVTISSAIVLMVIIPLLVRFLRPYYKRTTIRSHLVEEDASNSKEAESETSDRLDVHLAIVACVVTAIFQLCAAASTTMRALIFSGICLGFTSLHSPTFRSLVAGSVDPLMQGEAIAAIEMVSNAGCILSPIIMGTIFTATIGTRPLLLFYVHLVVVLMSGVLLLLVRDADRYQKPCEAR